MIFVEEKALPVSFLEQYRKSYPKEVFSELALRLISFDKKIVVLDDDPTGVQTVHGVSVYTNWLPQTLEQAFQEKDPMFFILTNSRGMTSSQTAKAHTEIAERIFASATRAHKDFILISRSDSTLRGHYPLETETLKHVLESQGYPAFDGEIIVPFFQEGGRYTIDNMHFVREKEWLKPAAQTEFARDKSFSYTHSYLPNWCEEKTGGSCQAEDVVCVSLDDLSGGRIDKITDQLLQVFNFGKVVVNSVSYEDIAVFSLAFLAAIEKGKRFLFRSAAAVPKVLGNVTDQPLLTREKLITSENACGGIIIVGSHVHKTTEQLRILLESGLPLESVALDVRTALKKDGLEQESKRVTDEVNAKVKEGKTVVVYTSREKVAPDTDDKDLQVAFSMRISNALTHVITDLSVRPSFIIAKGGITSSDIGTKALNVQRAFVLGQVSPGIPVWLTGPESKFPGMPFVIFPGNVGNADTLSEIVSMLLVP